MPLLVDDMPPRGARKGTPPQMMVMTVRDGACQVL